MENTMERSTQQIIEQCLLDSYAGKASFGAIVVRLMEAGIEAYTADYRTRTTTYYMPDGATYTLAMQTMDAGCVGYTVWIAGRHVAYVGRRGEVHVERFPD
jgi:uncharacterized protein YbcV (DUF1398 family)